MIDLLLASAAALGVLLCFQEALARRDGRRSVDVARWVREQATGLDERAGTALARAGVEGISPARAAMAVLAIGVAGSAFAAAVVGPGPAAVLVGAAVGSVPVAAWRRRRTATRRAARTAWPRLVDELRVLTGAVGRPLPQALIEVGARGPVELRPAFRAAAREWSLTTDFDRTVAVLKARLDDSTADATLETLLVAHSVGGDVDDLLQRLADDRRRDLRDRQEAEAKQAGARVARLFVVLVPVGMAVAGLNVGDGRDAYRTGWGQTIVAVGVAMVVACWWWASRIMRLPEPERVFDR